MRALPPILTTLLLAATLAIVAPVTTSPAAQQEVRTPEVSFLEIARVLDAASADAPRLARFLGVEPHGMAGSADQDLPPASGGGVASGVQAVPAAPPSVSMGPAYVEPAHGTSAKPVSIACEGGQHLLAARSLLSVSARGPPCSLLF
jgi:hypothetical protein